LKLEDDKVAPFLVTTVKAEEVWTAGTATVTFSVPTMKEILPLTVTLLDPQGTWKDSMAKGVPVQEELLRVKISFPLV
jgi:hypothetical protein